ncbi:MAG: SurA N-terminal domain-containing protein [Erythrobacter sp.]|nr:SurA N-terminal domain-containing protein [Erythrobacter sp.]
MIQFIRKFFQSKIGVGLTLAFLAVIAVAFAAGDVLNNSVLSGLTGSDKVAEVGDRDITAADLDTAVRNAHRQAQTQNPTLTLEAFIAQGGMDDVLESMLNRAALAEFAHSLGLRSGDRLVDSEIVNIPAFQGVDGSFSADAFRAALRQQGLTESAVRDDIALGLYVQQTALPVSYGATLPVSFARRYAQLLGETRHGSAAVLTADDFAPQGDPTDAELQGFYQANSARYIRPERRVIRYAAFGIDAVGDLPPVTAEQIAARYERDATQYAASETRTFTQLVLPTQAAAQAVVNEVNGGMTLEASARAKGLETVTLTSLDRAALTTQTSAAVATAGFAAQRGALAGPARGNLGWYVLRVDGVTENSGQTLAQATPTIRTQLEGEARQTALEDLTERLEDEFRDGRTLSEAASELGVGIITTPELTATGQVYGTTQTAPPEMARLLSFAFQMEEGAPELTEIVPGQQFLIFDVSDVTPSAAAPLAEITDTVTADWRKEQGLAAAGAAAARIIERVEGGATLAAAVAAEEVNIPTPLALNISRAELRNQQRLPRPTVLFFSMAEGSVKRVEEEEAGAWFVVQLNDIETPDLADNNPQVQAVRTQLGQAVGEEYVDQFVAAVQDHLDARTNDEAVAALRTQLLGITNN